MARVADEVPGLTVTPTASQTRQAALLVAHLQAGKLPDPEADKNVKETPDADNVPAVPAPRFRIRRPRPTPPQPATPAPPGDGPEP